MNELDQKLNAVLKYAENITEQMDNLETNGTVVHILKHLIFSLFSQVFKRSSHKASVP